MICSLRGRLHLRSRFHRSTLSARQGLSSLPISCSLLFLIFMEIILYSQVLFFFFRKGCEILLPPRAEAYVPTPEASNKGLRISFIFLPHRAVCTVRLILFHIIVPRYNSPYNQGRLHCRPPFSCSSSGNTDLRNCPAQSIPAQQ